MIQELLDADGLIEAGYDESQWFLFVEHVVETLDVGPGTKVWAAGCGAGSFLYPLSLNGYVVGGIDPSAEHIALARSAIPRGSFDVGSPLDFNPAEPWDVVVSGRGLRECRDLNDVRGLLARMAAKATHAVALLRVEEDRARVNRTMLLRLLTQIGVSAVQFEPAEAARVNVFARVKAPT
jgi:SAM-dependent methyltransferase